MIALDLAGKIAAGVLIYLAVVLVLAKAIHFGGAELPADDRPAGWVPRLTSTDVPDEE